MARFLTVTIATYLAALPPAAALSAQPPPPPAVAKASAPLDVAGLSARLEARLARMAEEDGFQGQVMVDVGGRTVFARAVGLADRTTQRPYRIDTQGEIGSISKSFTAAAVLKLKDEGKLKLDDPISAYLPGVPADKAAITLRQLLTHTAGLPDYVPGPLGQPGPSRDDAPITREEMERRVLAAPLAFAPGSRWAYSNAGYGLAAAIVERVSGRPFTDFLADEVIAPAGLKHSGFRPAYDAAGSDRARDGGTIADLSWGQGGPQWGLLGAGGVVSVPAEMIAWRRAFMAGRIVSPASVLDATTGGALEGDGGGRRYGLGVGLIDDPTYGRIIMHNGGDPWFTSDLRLFADHDMTIYVHTNSRMSATEAASILTAAAFGQPDRPMPEMASPGEAALVRKFADALASRDPAVRRAFLEANAGPVFLRREGIEAITARFAGISDSLAGATFVRFQFSGGRAYALFQPKGGGPVVAVALRFGGAPDAPKVADFYID